MHVYIGVCLHLYVHRSVAFHLILSLFFFPLFAVWAFYSQVLPLWNANIWCTGFKSLPLFFSLFGAVGEEVVGCLTAPDHNAWEPVLQDPEGSTGPVTPREKVLMFSQLLLCLRNRHVKHLVGSCPDVWRLQGLPLKLNRFSASKTEPHVCNINWRLGRRMLLYQIPRRYSFPVDSFVWM